MSRSNAVALIALTLVAPGCAQPEPESRADDFVPVVASDDDQVALALDDENQTIMYEAEEPFVRLGVMWDHLDATPPEVRMRESDTEWSDWTAIEVVFTEEESHAGHLDAPGGLARFYQVRFPAGPPSLMAIEPILELPDLSSELPVEGYDPDEDDPDMSDAAEGDIGSSQEALSMGSFAIHSRRAWGARAPRCRDRGPTPTRATIHHTVTPNNDSNPQRRLRQIQAYHMDSQGWCDIGYNYLVSSDGRVWRGRGALYIGAHVTNANSGNVGISFMGTHTTRPASLQQLRQTARLLVRLRRRGYPISLGRRDIKGHRDHGGTSCPGGALYEQIPRIIRIARSI